MSIKIITTVSEMEAFSDRVHKSGKNIGFVPTMGFLHDGHLSLIKKAAKENDITVVSVFVNPTQFAPNEDFEKYPRNIERDTQLSEEAGADIIFLPTAEEMYPLGCLTYVNVESLTDKLCGLSRPSHFRGVTTVVAKLFNIVRADKAYFGEKDFQQLAVIKKMVGDLNMSVKIVPCPIIREIDGLALSSRNVYLTEKQRRAAALLYKSLCLAKEMIESGEKKSTKVKAKIKQTIEISNLAEVDYIEIVDITTLESVDSIEKSVTIALAVKYGTTRLIDNITV